MINKHMERSSRPLGIREIQIKTWDIIICIIKVWLKRKIVTTSNAGNNEEQLELFIHWWWKCKMVSQETKAISYKTKYATTSWPSNGSLGTYSREIKACDHTYALSSVQSLSRVWLFVAPRTAARQASLSITNSWSRPKPTSTESVAPSTVSSSAPSPCPPSLPASGSFPASHLSASGGPSAGATQQCLQRLYS